MEPEGLSLYFHLWSPNPWLELKAKQKREWQNLDPEERREFLMSAS